MSKKRTAVNPFGWQSNKRKESLKDPATRPTATVNQNVMRQINMDIFRNIV